MKFKFLLSFLVGGAMLASAQGFKDGINYYRADMPEEASIILNKTYNQATTDQSLSDYYLGQISLEEGKSGEAEALFNRGIALNPKNGFNYVGLGQAALMRGEKSAADGYFKEAKKNEKKNAVLYCDVARAYWTVDPVKYRNEIKKWLDEARKVNMECPAIYILEADMAVSEDLGKAAGLYEMAMNYDVNNEYPDANVKYARTYFRVNPTYAINALKQLLEKNPDSALAQRELAEKYYDNNQLTMAAEQYGKYIQNPNHFIKDEQRYVGLLYFGKKYDESLKLAKEILAKDPDNFYMKRMVMYNNAIQENYPAALAAADIFFAAKNGEFNANDYSIYSDILMETGDALAATQALEKAIALNPEKMALYKDISAAYTQADMYPEAAQAMQKYIDAGDYSVNDMLILSRRYQNVAGTSAEGSPERSDAIKRAIDAVNYVVEKVPDNPQVLFTKAKILLLDSNGNITPEVVDIYKNVAGILEAKPELTEGDKSDLFTAYNFLGSYSLEKERNYESARYYYTKMLELRPDVEGIQELINKIPKK